jgi:hypothetical protein
MRTIGRLSATRFSRSQRTLKGLCLLLAMALSAIMAAGCTQSTPSVDVLAEGDDESVEGSEDVADE